MPSSLPAVLGPLRRSVALLLPVLLTGGLVAGCGGGGDDNESVTELLDRAFQNPIGSADVTLDIAIELEGVEELEDPIEVGLSGPYEAGEDGKIPSVDWEITVRAQNQSFNAGLTSTGDRAFIGFQGTDYEIDRAAIAQLNRQLAAAREREDEQDLSDFGVTARDWVVDAEEQGDEDVAGAETTHVSGKLDVTRVLDDLNTVVERASELGRLGQQAPPALTDEQKGQIEDIVEDPGFDAYVGKDDERIRRLSADFEFDVPEDARERVGGLEGGRISFSIEFANIGSAQPISLPDDVRPIAELTQQLQGLLGGALGAPPAGGGDGAGEPAPQTDEEKQRAYEECVKTDPGDESVRAFCEVLLQ